MKGLAGTRYGIRTDFSHDYTRGYFMKKELHIGVMLTTGLVIGLNANLHSGERIEDIYRRNAKRSIETNNKSIEEAVDFGQAQAQECIRAFYVLSDQLNQELKKLLRTEVETDMSSTLKTEKESRAIIEKCYDRLKKNFEQCIKKAQEQKKNLILQYAEDTKKVVEDFEVKLGKKRSNAIEVMTSESPAEQDAEGMEQSA